MYQQFDGLELSISCDFHHRIGLLPAFNCQNAINERHLRIKDQNFQVIGSLDDAALRYIHHWYTSSYLRRKLCTSQRSLQ